MSDGVLWALLVGNVFLMALLVLVAVRGVRRVRREEDLVLDLRDDVPAPRQAADDVVVLDAPVVAADGPQATPG